MASGHRAWHGAFLAALVTSVLLLGATPALAVSGLTIGAPGDLHVNATTGYSASVSAGVLETVTQAVFTFPANTVVSGATVTLSSGTATVVRDNVNRRVTITTSAFYLLGGTFTATVNNVVNPSEPGSYTRTVSVTGNSTVSGTSAAYNLISNTTAPTIGSITLASPTETTVTTTTVTVTVGALGRLAADPQPGGVTTPNRIVITFPAGYTVPPSPAASSVTINGVPLSVAPTVTGQQVTIRIPSGVAIPANSTATVVFLPSFGMANPAAGAYTIQGRTDAQTGTGTSASYTVTAMPTTLTVSSANAPGAATVAPGDSAAVDGFQLQRNTSSNTVSVSSVTLTNSGTAPSSTVASATIYRDNGNGAFGAGDVRLSTAGATFTGSSATVTLDSAEAVTTSAQQYWVVYRFAPGAADGAVANSQVSGIAHTANSLSLTAVTSSAMTVDAAAPTVAITAPPADGAVLTGGIPPYTIAGLAADTVSGVSSVRVGIQRASDGQWFNGIGWQSGATTVLASTTDGWATWSYAWSFTPIVQDNADTYTITATVADAIGLEGQAVRAGVGIDNIAPSVVSASAVDPTHVDVTFSEDLAVASVDAFDFTVSALIVNGATLLPSGHVVRVATDLQTPGQSYNVAAGLGSVTDVGGNSNVAPTTASFIGDGARIRIASAFPPPAAFAISSAVLPTDGFTLEKTAGPAAAAVSSLTIENTGTATASDVTGVSIYRDQNTNNAFDSGADTLLNATPAPFSGTSAVVTLDSNEPVDATTQYFVVYRFAEAAADGRFATSKVVALGTNATVIDNVTVRGNELTIDTAPPAAPVMIASAVSSSTINTSWNAVADATSGLSYYALRRGNGSLVTTTTETSHTVNSLTPDTDYGFYVEALDVVGNVSRSNTATATTFDSTAPMTTISFPGSDGRDGWWRIPPTITATTDEPALTFNSFVSATGPWDSWTGAVSAPEGFSTIYYYSQDPGGNVEPISSHGFKVDSIGPTTPTAVASVDSSTAITVTWSPSTDLTSGFDVYAVRKADGSLVGTTTMTSAQITGLVPATTYGLYVQALDVAGNDSRSETVYAHTTSDQSAVLEVIPPHVALASDTDICAMCHVAHTSANAVGSSVDSTRNALIVGIGTRSMGDVQLCYACHGVDTLGSTRAVQSEFQSGPGHVLTPDTSEFGPDHKQCSDCHDVHGSARTPEGGPYAALLRSRDALGNLHQSGEEYCAACHTVRSGNVFPGLALWEQTAHADITTPTSGTEIICSTCHEPHGSPYPPSIQAQFTPPAVAATVTITANDRQLCQTCHAAPVRSWSGSTLYATSSHATSTATVTALGEWSSRDATQSEQISRRVGECQNCHAAMGAPNGAGGVLPRLLNAVGQRQCLECHKADGAAQTDFAKLAHNSASGASELAVTYGATSETLDYGRVHLYSRLSTSSATLVGPRSYAENGHVGATAAGNIDGVDGDELVTATPGSSAITLLSNSPFYGLAARTITLLQQASFVAIGDVLDDAGNLPEVVTADSTTVRVYRWNGTGLNAITAYSASGEITGMQVGKVLSGGLKEIVLTMRQASPPDKLAVLRASGTNLTLAGEYPTRAFPVGPSIGDLDGDGIGEIAVANSGVTSPTLSVFSGGGSELMAAGSASDTSATATLIEDILPGLTLSGSSGAEVSVALARIDGPARVEVFPQASGGLGTALTQTLGTQTNPSTLAAGELDTDGDKELVIGLSGYFSRSAVSATPPGVVIVHASGDGTTLGIADAHLGGGVELAGGTRVVVADLGSIGESRHPIEAAEGTHNSSEVSPVAEHVACVDCHNTHEANGTTATPPALPGPLRGAAGVEIKNISATVVQLTQRDSVSQEYEVCLKCHSTWAGGGLTSIASLVNTRVASFHPVEGQGKANNATGNTFTGSMSATSLIYCTDCHGNATASEPSGPHRSTAAPLLVRPTIGLTSSSSDVLCFKCHRHDVYGTGVADGTAGLRSGFWGSSLPASRQALHAFHTQSGFACASCHVSHGSVDLRSLLRDNLGWDAGVANGGACTNGCHASGARREYIR